MTPRHHACPTIAAMTAAAADAIAAALSQAIAARGAAVFVATGGSTAPAIYALLRDTDLDWARVTVTLSDDRVVAADHPASNLRLLRETLLQGRAQAASCVALTDAPGVDALAWPADVCLLGMGADLHIASIFPHGAGMAQARDARARVVATTPDPLPAAAPFSRLTLTLPTLAASRALIVCFSGADKAAALAAAAPTAPISALIQSASDRLVFYTAP